MAKPIITSYRQTSCWGDPPIFRDDNDVLEWAVGQGAFPNVEGAGRAFAALRRQYGSRGLWARWLGVVAGRLQRRSKVG